MGWQIGHLRLIQALLLKPGHIRLEETAIPLPGEGQLLVKVKAALTCGTDLKAYMRGHPFIPMPGPLGHEFSGVVAAKGKNTRKFREGDEVMAVHSAPCLLCPMCKRGLHNLCDQIMENKVLGAFAEYILLPAPVVRQNTFIKPASISFEEAALLEPLSCVVHAIHPLKIKSGNNALIIGAGPIGMMHAALLKNMGATVSVVDMHTGRLSKAKALGADKSFRADTENLKERLAAVTPDRIGFDLVVECTGRPEVWESSISYLRRGGTLVLFGGCPPGSTVSYSTHRLHYDEITLKGSFHFSPKDVKTACDFLSGGRLDLKKLISGSYGLSGLEEALNRLSKGDGIKYALLPSRN